MLVKRYSKGYVRTTSSLLCRETEQVSFFENVDGGSDAREGFGPPRHQRASRFPFQFGQHFHVLTWFVLSNLVAMPNHKKRKLESQSTGVTSHIHPNKRARPTKSSPARKVEATIPFDPEDRILLVGEGDFSFAKSIVESHGCYDITATSFDTKDDLFEKYKPQAEVHVQYLEDEGQAIHYGIDATKLDSIKSLKRAGLFDRIIFNFPHVGGKSKDVNRQVRFNQELLVKFFKAAMPLLSNDGTIIVTLFEGEPYTLWNIRDLARHSGLEVQRSFKFQADAYPGYGHSRTLGNIEGGGGWKGEDRDARSYVFQKKGTRDVPGNAVKKAKRGTSDSSGDEG